MSALDRAIVDPPRVAGVGERSPMAGLERRTVGFVDVLAQSVGATAPAAAAATLPALIAVRSGHSLLVCLVLAWILVAGVGGAVGQFTRRMAAPGSLYTFVTKGIGPSAGFVTAAGQAVGYAFVAMFGLVGAALSVQTFLASVGAAASSAAVTGLGVVALGAVCFVVLRRGIRISARVTLVVEVVSVVLLLVLLVTVLSRAGAEALAAPFRAGLPGPDGLVAGTAVAITAFVGFETAASLGREAERPFLTVPRTMRWTLIVVGFAYLLSAYTQEAGGVSFGLQVADNDVALSALSDGAGVPLLGRLLDLGQATSFLACAIASLTALARVVFSLGREGVLPRAVGFTDPLRSTPLGALAVVVPVTVALPLVLLAGGLSPWRAMSVLIAVSAVGYIVAYVLVAVAAPAFLHRIGELTRSVLWGCGAVAVALTGVLGVYLAVVGGTDPLALSLVGVVVLGGGSGYLYVRMRQPEGFARMGLFDEPISDDLLGGR
ncbi:APC family permease [Nocardioides sp. NPDC126508]